MQRAAIAVEIENDRPPVARRNVPRDDALAVGRSQRYLLASGKPACVGVVCTVSGKYIIDRC